MSRQVGDENVILDLESGTYFGLDPVGARIWQLIAEGRSLEEVCDAMMAEFDVSRSDIERDTAQLVEQLVTSGLLAASEG